MLKFKNRYQLILLSSDAGERLVGGLGREIHLEDDVAEVRFVTPVDVVADHGELPTHLSSSSANHKQTKSSSLLSAVTQYAPRLEGLESH